MNNLELEKVSSNQNNAFTYSHFKDRFFWRTLHFHPEMEIVSIVQGEGVCIAANEVTPFKTGDLFIFPSNMPHYFRSDPSYYQEENTALESRSTYIQFTEKILPADFRIMPGCIHIKALIHQGERGLKWSDTIQDRVSEIFTQMEESEGFFRLHKLYELLDYLGRNLPASTNITSSAHSASMNSNEATYQRVVQYINEHFNTDITMSELSEYAHMNTSSLCRYFKRKSGQSVFNYLMDVRIAYAKEQLALTDHQVSRIAYDAGFNSVPNFNTQFKRYTQCSPSEYRKKLTD